MLSVGLGQSGKDAGAVSGWDSSAFGFALLAIALLLAAAVVALTVWDQGRERRRRELDQQRRIAATHEAAREVRVACEELVERVSEDMGERVSRVEKHLGLSPEVR